MQYQNNQDYQIAFTAFKGQENETHFYVPKDTMNGYHMSRKVAGQVQEMYGGAGITKELLSDIVGQMKDAINSDEKAVKIRTNMAAMVANLEYRLKYPIDEMAALRMAALYLFIEGEDPNHVHPHITEQKVKIAMQDPEAYAFFLHIGSEFQGSWRESTLSLEDEDYIQARNEMIRIFSSR